MGERDTPMRPQTILIIENHTSVRTLLAQVLEDAGYQVYEAANGREGLKRFHAWEASDGFCAKLTGRKKTVCE